MVVSAGNEGEKHRGLTSPAYDPFILSIGADDLSGTAAVADDVVPSWSSRGLGRNPDLVAPGRSIASLRDPNSALDLAHPEARVGDDLLKGSGTSQAAAVVSGAVALLLERRPDLTPDQVKAMVKSSADPLSGPGPDAQGAGRLNIMRALAAASPDPASVVQPFQPAAIRGIVAKLVAGLSKGRQAEVGPGQPRRLELGRRQVGRREVGRRQVGRLVLGRLLLGRLLLGRLVLGRLLVGRLVLGRLLVGRLLVGRLVLGRRLSRARPGLHAT